MCHPPTSTSAVTMSYLQRPKKRVCRTCTFRYMSPSPFSRWLPTTLISVHSGSVQSTLHNMNTTVDKIRKLFEMHILMGVVHLPPVNLYWNPMMKVPRLVKPWLRSASSSFEIICTLLHLRFRFQQWRPPVGSASFSGTHPKGLLGAGCWARMLNWWANDHPQRPAFHKAVRKRQATSQGHKSLLFVVEAVYCRTLLYTREKTRFLPSWKKYYGLCSGVVLHLSKRKSKVKKIWHWVKNEVPINTGFPETELVPLVNPEEAEHHSTCSRGLSTRVW